jgi:hypothetical protein
MKAKILVYALPALILATIHLAEAQQPTKVRRIGWLSTTKGPRIFFVCKNTSFSLWDGRRLLTQRL